MNITPQRDTDTRSVNLSSGSGSSPSPIGRLLRYLDKLAANAFFGRVTISFQNGKVADIRIEQNKKLDEL
jgi:hypothetical protein